MRHPFRPFNEALTRVLLILCLALTGTTFALAQAPLPGMTAEEETPAPAEATAEDASAEEEAAPEPDFAPALTEPGTDTDELVLRLIPLTADELALLAAEWQAIVKAKTEEVVQAQIEIRDRETQASETESEAASADHDEAADQARERIAALTQERKALFDKYSAVVDAWEKKGGDEAAIAGYRAYRSSIIVEETRTADAETLMAQALAWLTDEDGGVQLAIDIGVILLSLAGLFLFARLVRGFVSRWIGRVPNLSKLLQSFLVVVVYWLTFAIGFMVVLSGLGIDISPIFALIGGASFILAFALQSTLGNLASGLMIMLNRPFDEGDYVDVGGVAGTVKSVSIMSTELVTPDNQIIVVPNSNVWGNTITNVTTSPTRRVDLVFGISYGDSIEKAQEVLEKTVAEHPLVLAEPAPMIRVNELADSSVNFVCRPWVKGADYWTVYWDLTRQVKENFDAAGISIPFPQQDVHMHHVEKPAPVERSAPSESRSAGEGTGEDEAKGAPAHVAE